MSAADSSRHSESNLSTTKGTNDLISYLAARFSLVLFVTMAVESLIIWVENRLLVPALQLALAQASPPAPQTTTSLLALLRRVVLLLQSAYQANYLQMVGLARGSLTLLLLLVMAALLLLPPMIGAAVSAHLVTRKVRELQQQRERELAEIDRQRNRFMTDIAHDLRSPLMAISGMAHALADGVVRDDATRDEYLQSICHKTDGLSSLVSSVFEYTKLGGGAYTLERTVVDLPELLLREAAAAYTDIEDAGMELVVEVPEVRCQIDADATQLARVVANLLTNAVRHNPTGTEIALRLVLRAGVADVVVADTGAAIAQDPAELFRPFSRGDVARTATGGSGLGLSICKRVADLHGYGLELVQPYGRWSKAFVLTCTTV